MSADQIISVIMLLFFTITLVLILVGQVKAFWGVAILSLTGMMAATFWESDRIAALTVSHIGSIETDAAAASRYLSQIKDIKSQAEKEEEKFMASASQADGLSKLYSDFQQKDSIAEQQIGQAAQGVHDLAMTLDRTSILTHLVIEILQAQADSRAAYMELRKDGEDAEFPYHELAKASFASIGADVVELNLYYPVPWDRGVDPSKLTFQNIVEAYESSLPRYRDDRAALAEYIESRNDLSKKDRLGLLLRFIDGDASLKVALYAARGFSHIAGMKNATTDLTQFDKWWSENQSKL